MYGYVVLRRDAVVRVICEWLSVGDSACLLVFFMCHVQPTARAGAIKKPGRKQKKHIQWLMVGTVTHGFTPAMV